jgi:hypothetical protein
MLLFNQNYGIIFRLHTAREMADIVAQISLIAYLSFFQLIKLTHLCSFYIIEDLRWRPPKYIYN